MSNSIFHVRPLDSGKGWAISGRREAPMDKIQAQRAVFQLRRKVVNSAPKASPVNNLLPGERVDFRKVRP